MTGAALKKFESRMWSLTGVDDKGPGWQWHIPADTHPQIHRLYESLAANDNKEVWK